LWYALEPRHSPIVIRWIEGCCGLSLPVSNLRAPPPSSYGKMPITWKDTLYFTLFSFRFKDFGLPQIRDRADNPPRLVFVQSYIAARKQIIDFESFFFVAQPTRSLISSPLQTIPPPLSSAEGITFILGSDQLPPFKRYFLRLPKIFLSQYLFFANSSTALAQKTSEIKDYYVPSTPLSLSRKVSSP